MRLLIAIAACLWPTLCPAQSLSVEDLQKQIDQEMSKGSEYIALLDHSDPKRALAALKVMLASGDPELIKLAADHGLYSSNPAVRAEALKGFLATNPRIDMFFSEKGSKGDFSRAMENRFKVQPNGSGVAAVSMTVGEYDPSGDCYIDKGNGGRCWLMVRPEVIQVRFDDNWNQVTFNDDAALAGNVDLGWAEQVPVRIQLR